MTIFICLFCFPHLVKVLQENERDGNRSIKLFRLLSNSSSHQFGIDRLNLRDFLDDFRDCVFSVGIVVVDWVSNEKNRLDVLQRLELGKLIPRLDLVVADQKGVESNARLQVELLDIVV